MPGPGPPPPPPITPTIFLVTPSVPFLDVQLVATNFWNAGFQIVSFSMSGVGAVPSFCIVWSYQPGSEYKQEIVVLPDNVPFEFFWYRTAHKFPAFVALTGHKEPSEVATVSGDPKQGYQDETTAVDKSVGLIAVVFELHAKEFDLVAQPGIGPGPKEYASPQLILDEQFAPGTRGQQHTDSLDRLWIDGYMPRSVCIYRKNGETLFAATLWPRGNDHSRYAPFMAWTWRVATSQADYDEQRAVFEAAPNPLRIAMGQHLQYKGLGGVHDEFVTVWVDDPETDAKIYPNLEKSQLAPTINDELVNHGRWPVNVTVAGAPQHRRFFAVFAPTDAPTPRKATISPPSMAMMGGVDPTATINAYMLARMRDNGVRCAQLAIARQNKLVLARAYTHAEKGYTPATIYNTGRIGSISKAFTKLAVLRLLENKEVGPDDLGDLQTNLKWSIADKLHKRYGRSTEDDSNAGDARLGGKFNNVTVGELITHTGGISTDWMTFDYEAVTELGKWMPLLPDELMAWVYSGNRQIVDWHIGQFAYNGFSPILLARLLETQSSKLNAQDEQGIVNELISSKLPLVRPRRSNPYRLAGDDELIYHSIKPDIWIPHADVVDPTQPGSIPLVRFEYSQFWPVALAAGGWVMAAIDLARLGATICSIHGGPGSLVYNPKLYNGLLARSTAALIFDELDPSEPVEANPDPTQPPDAVTVTRAGWFVRRKRDVGQAIGRTPPWTIAVGHDGFLDGGQADLVLRDDGTVIAWVANGNFKDGGEPDSNHLLDLVDAIDWPSDDLFPVVEPKEWG